MPTQDYPKAIATADCSQCGRTFSTTVLAPDGENSAYIRCSRCEHINHTRDFDPR